MGPRGDAPTHETSSFCDVRLGATLAAWRVVKRIVLAWVLVGCASSPSSDHVDATESAWGHLADDALVADAPQFLINKPRGSSFRICAPRYMVDALPDLEVELGAAASIWGSYLGRAVPVAVEVRDLPRARADQNVDDLAASYHTACGDGFDVVVGFAKLDERAVGLTGASYRYIARPDGTRQITAFSRFLFLRDYDLQPSRDPEGNAEHWIEAHANPDLPTRMLARTDTHYAEKNAYWALPVLTHEMGHVWGMCDQYEGSTNCDQAHSSSHPVEASIMGARGATQPFYLTDDDITGIRALGARPGFAHDWGSPSTTPPAPIAKKPVDLARIENVYRDGGALVVKYGVVTAGPARYEFSLSTDGVTYRPLSNGFSSDAPLDVSTGRLRITLNAGAAAYRVRLTVTPASGAPVSVDGAEGP